MAPFKKKIKACTLKEWLENSGNDNRQLCSSGEDRLSSLPDNLLLVILSLIPLSSAVATSILSHRWRHLWTYLTHISFDFSKFNVNNFHDFHNTLTIVNQVITKLTSPKIHTFHLPIPYFTAQKQACPFLLFSSIHEICLQNPEVIYIGFSNHNYVCHLSTSLFKTQSLVQLKLHFPFQFDFASDQIVINLPNLKILDIYLDDSHRGLMHTLFKSCPLLEHLVFNFSLEENDHHVDIIAPNLKSLTIRGYSKNHYLLLIDAPKLVNLETHEIIASVYYHFVNNIRCLQFANIIIPEYHVDNGNDYLSKILALFHGISSARSLFFNGFFHDPLLDAALPSFPNLVNLEFIGSVVDSSSLLPSCLLNNVKTISIYDMKLNDYGIRVVQDILINGTVLEKFHVYLWEYDGEGDEDEPLKNRVWMEYEFAMKLFKLPRISSNCQIELSGEIINASCKDFKYDHLTCKLKNLAS